jgi:hypothetical protein
MTSGLHTLFSSPGGIPRTYNIYDSTISICQPEKPQNFPIKQGAESYADCNLLFDDCLKTSKTQKLDSKIENHHHLLDRSQHKIDNRKYKSYEMCGILNLIVLFSRVVQNMDGT